MSDSKLLPCPFCGSAKLKSGGDDKVVAIWCTNCEATGPNQYGEYQWNTRSALPAQGDAQLREALENIALLDEADGHELKASHALEAIAIATKALGKHPSELHTERYALPAQGEIARVPSREEIARILCERRRVPVGSCTWDAYLADADAVLALSTPQAQEWRPPEGWKLVPVKITPEIACALEDAAPPDKWPDGDPHGAIPQLMKAYADTWARVLAASPCFVTEQERVEK